MQNKLAYLQTKEKDLHPRDTASKKYFHFSATVILLLATALTLPGCGRKPVEINSPATQKQYSYPPADSKWRDGTLPEDSKRKPPKAAPTVHSDEFTR